MFKRVLLGLFGALAGLLPAGRAARATELWMFAFEPPWRRIKGWPANDYMDLFAPGAPWQQAQAAVSVMSLNLRFVLTASDADLATVVDGLRRGGIKLSIQAQPLVRTRACGTGIESFGPPDEMAKAAERLKRLGADLRYVWMDEPLYFGHLFPGKPERPGCRYPAAQSLIPHRSHHSLPHIPRTCFRHSRQPPARQET